MAVTVVPAPFLVGYTPAAWNQRHRDRILRTLQPDQSGNAYVEQLSVDIVEGLDIEILYRAFNHVLRKHSVLRTSISYEDFSRPVLMS